MDNPDLQRQIRLLQEESKEAQLHYLERQVEANIAKIVEYGVAMGDIRAVGAGEYDERKAEIELKIEGLRKHNDSLRDMIIELSGT